MLLDGAPGGSGLGPRRWVILGVCVLGFMQSYVHRFGFAPLIPGFIADLGLTYAAAGTIMSAYFWTYGAAQVPVGVLTDRWGPRRVMLAFLSVLVAGVLAFTLSRSYAQSLLSRCLVGLGAAAVWLPGLRLINEWFGPSERGRATGLLSAGGGVGGTTALLLIPLLAERLGWRMGYGLLLIPLALTLILVGLVIRPLAAESPDARPVARGEAPPGDETAPGALAQVGRVLSAPAMWPLNIAVLFSYGGYIGLITWVPTFLAKDQGLTGAAAGLVTGLMTAGTIVSWPAAGYLSDRFGRRRPLYLWSQGVSAAACLAFALVVPHSGAAGAAAVAALTGLGLGGIVIPFVMVTELFPAELVGTASGVVNTFCFIGALLIPVALGYILDITGSFPMAFLGCAAVQSLALVTAAFTRETRKAGQGIMVSS